MEKCKPFNDPRTENAPIVTEIQFNVAAEQVYPGSGFMVWDSCENSERPWTKNEQPVFYPTADVIARFKEHFVQQFWTKLKKRRGKCRIKVSIEWIP